MYIKEREKLCEREKPIRKSNTIVCERDKIKKKKLIGATRLTGEGS